jgi:CRP-like cAMP-binding protein
MRKFYKILKNCPLFENINYDSMDEIFSKIDYKIKNYTLNEIVYLEDTKCNEISIVLEGNINIQSISSSGNIFTVIQFPIESIFGEGLIFSNLNNYPITATSSTKNTKILQISTENFVEILHINSTVSINYMKILSNRITLLNSKLKLFAFDSIRKKISFFILEKYQQNNYSNKINIGMSKKTLAEYFAIPRPSLSRELINMKKEGIIDYDKKFFYILDLESIKNILYN